jgi:hypothetical protein
MTGLPGWLVITYEAMLIVGALSCWGFIARYVTRFRWWTTDIGRHLISMSTIVGLFYTYFAVATLWPDMPGRAWIRTALFAALTCVLVWRWFMFERLRRQTARTKQAKKEGTP